MAFIHALTQQELGWPIQLQRTFDRGARSLLFEHVHGESDRWSGNG